jgi:hypothetical protein
MATPTSQGITADALLEMVEKGAGMDSIEMKMSVPDDQRMALADIGIDVMKAQIRQVYFFDTPSLDLFKRGVVLRGRRSQGDDDDTVVKLRPVQAETLPKKVRGSPNFKLEMDVTRGGQVISGSMKGERKAGAVMDVVGGGRTIERLFTKEQREFFEEFASGGPGWTDVIPLGPMNVIKVKFAAPGVSEDITVEQWFYPGQQPAVELSTKSAPREAMKLLAEARRFLREHGLSATGQQEPKTRKALEFLAARLAGPKPVPRKSRSRATSHSRRASARRPAARRTADAPA